MLTSSSRTQGFERVGCYSQLEGGEGFLVSPNYPNNYPHGFDCHYDIARPSAKYCGVKLYGKQYYWAFITLFADLNTWLDNNQYNEIQTYSNLRKLLINLPTESDVNHFLVCVQNSSKLKVLYYKLSSFLFQIG